MTQINDGMGSLNVDDRTLEALRALEEALDAGRLTARVRLMARNGTTVSLVLGRDAKDRSQLLHAKPLSTMASNLPAPDIEVY